jgi:hypothetical protein
MLHEMPDISIFHDKTNITFQTEEQNEQEWKINGT